jgi:hypothetical protein
MIIKQNDNYTTAATVELSNGNIETWKGNHEVLSPEAWLLLTSSKKAGRIIEEAKLDIL